MQKKFDDFSMQDALRISKSDAGQKLMTLLQQQNSATMAEAAAQASRGDYTALQETVRQLLQTPGAQQLLNQLKETNNG